MARYYHLQGDTPFWIHSAEYSNLFTGVGYAHHVPVRLPHTRMDAVVDEARKQYTKVLVAQAFGPSWAGGYDQPHNVRAWLNCGFTVEQFNDRVNFPLVFDQRSVDRENFLYRRYIHSNRPLILLSLGAKSSIFNGRDRLAEAIRNSWSSKCEILDLNTIKAGRFFDFLGLLDRASLLITVDTSFLHLAAALSVPVVALIGDNQRTAAAPRCNVVLRVGYSEWLKRLKEIHARISAL